MVKKYRKKPVEIEAIELVKSSKGVKEALEFMGQSVDMSTRVNAEKFCDYLNEKVYPKNGLEIETLEGTMLASFGDYIIKGVNGEFYPCKYDIFEKTYEEV